MNTCSFCWLDPAGASCGNSFRRDKMVKYIRAIEFRTTKPLARARAAGAKITSISARKPGSDRTSDSAKNKRSIRLLKLRGEQYGPNRNVAT
jgi:hypothetical protein